jgi:fermentation-respiration switch protein FrsA (DUF1100 family)
MKKIFYFLLLLFLSVAQQQCSTSAFFYYPDKKVVYHPDTIQCTYEDVYFSVKSGSAPGGRTADSSLLHGWFIRPKSGTAVVGTVLLFHGNGGNVGSQFASLVPLAAAGFQSLVFDYRGYGNSPGKPSQEHVLEDGLAALDYIRNRADVKGKPLILFGQSLGGHLAVVVAAQCQQYLSALILEDAFSSHEEIAVYRGRKDYHAPGFLTRWCVRSRYDAIDVIDRISIPKLIIHSIEDETVPYYMGKDLFNKAKDPKEFWEIKGPHIRAYRLYPAEFVDHFRKIIGK